MRQHRLFLTAVVGALGFTSGACLIAIVNIQSVAGRFLCALSILLCGAVSGGCIAVLAMEEDQ